MLPPLPLSLLIAAIAFLYASIGAGGASGYLAAMSLFHLPPEQMAGTALLLNVAVAGISLRAYGRQGYHEPRLAWPFLAGSLPAALLSSQMPLSHRAYHLLLAGVLAYAGVRLWLHNGGGDEHDPPQPPPWPLAVVVGGGIGLLSGMVGIGGGIFLSLIIVTAGWGHAKHAAGASALFVVGTSLSGLVGRVWQGSLHLSGWTITLLLVALSGGIGGGYLGAQHLSPRGVRRLLGTMLLLVAIRILAVI